MTQPSDLPPSEVPIRARHFRAPQGDGEVLIEPSQSCAAQILKSNRENLAAASQSSSLPHLEHQREFFGRQLICSAAAMTEQYRDISFDVPPHNHSRPFIVLAGHQPELFHPGVWLKNFVLHRIGQLPNTVAINLVVDNDLAQDSVRIPSGSLQATHTETIAVDLPGEAIPFEERSIISQETLQTFPARLRSALNDSQFGAQLSVPIVAEQLWKYVGRGNPEKNLGTSLAEGRHRLEQDFGLQTLEIPLSWISSGPYFCGPFAIHLFQQLGRFREIYNRSLKEYRVINRIRSTSHPVPELIAEDDWLESPFWIWTTENRLRRRLFVRSRRTVAGVVSIELTDREQITECLSKDENSTEGWFNQWSAIAEKGIKIRPRALITTMYARLFLSDLFVHGIGGAKYDELTDAIIRRFFGIEPPEYMTATGTVRLPIPRPDVSAADVLSAKQLTREIRFHPEKFVNDASPAIRESATQFAAQKAELLRQHQFHFRGASPEQFRALDDLNRQLSLLLTDVEIRLRDELRERERDLHTAKLLGSREFSFVLHPADELPEQLKKMAAGV